MNVLKRGMLILLLVAALGSVVAGEEPQTRLTRWAATKIERAGRLSAIDAEISLRTLERMIGRAGGAARDFYLTGLDAVEIATVKISEADVALGQATPERFLERAQARMESGQHDAALNDVNACLKLNSKNAEAWFLRGKIWGGKKHLLRAIHNFSRAIELQPLDCWAYEKRATFRLELGDQRGALEDAGKAIRLNPQAMLYVSRASIRRQAGDVRGAFDDLDEAIGLEPDEAFYYEVRGFIRLKLGEFDAAIADCTSALELDPKMAGAYAVRGIAKQAKKDYASADADCKAANRLDPASFPLTRAPREASSSTADASPPEMPHEENADAAEQYPAGAFSPFYSQRFAYGRSLEASSTSDRIEMPVDPELARQNRISELCKLAWRAATSPDERYRDGARAFDAAYEACKLTEFKDWHCVEVLAAACAERGEFADAVRYQTLAIRLRDKKDRLRLGRQSEKQSDPLPDLDGSDSQQRLERLESYRKHQAYRDER